MEKQEQKLTLGNRKGEQESLLGTGPIHRLFFSLAVPAILANDQYPLQSGGQDVYRPYPRGRTAGPGWGGDYHPGDSGHIRLAALVSMGGAPKPPL